MADRPLFETAAWLATTFVKTGGVGRGVFGSAWTLFYDERTIL